MAHRTLAGAAWDRLRSPRATTGFTRDVTRATLASRLKVPIQKLPRSATGSDLRRLRLHWWRCSNVPSGITRIRGGGSDCWPSVRRADAGPSVGGFDRMTSAAPLVPTQSAIRCQWGLPGATSGATPRFPAGLQCASRGGVGSSSLFASRRHRRLMSEASASPPLPPGRTAGMTAGAAAGVLFIGGSAARVATTGVVTTEATDSPLTTSKLRLALSLRAVATTPPLS